MNCASVAFRLNPGYLTSFAAGPYHARRSRNFKIMRPLLCLLLFGSAVSLFAADDYQPGPDSKPQADVPQGEVLKGTFDQSKIFPGTWREYWVYVPRQLDSSKPAPVMVKILL